MELKKKIKNSCIYRLEEHSCQPSDDSPRSLPRGSISATVEPAPTTTAAPVGDIAGGRRFLGSRHLQRGAGIGEAEVKRVGALVSKLDGLG